MKKFCSILFIIILFVGSLYGLGTKTFMLNGKSYTYRCSSLIITEYNEKGLETNHSIDGYYNRSNEYDLKGNLIKRITTYVDKSEKDTVYQAEYNDDGKIIREIDEEGHVSTWTYDSNGNCIIHKGKYGIEFSEYNSDNKIILSHYISTDSDITWFYEYNDKGLASRVYSLDGEDNYFIYNSNDIVIKRITKYKGNEYITEYDNEGHLLSEQSTYLFAGETIYYKYDSLGREIEIWEPNGNKVFMIYNGSSNNIHAEFSMDRRYSRLNDYDSKGQVIHNRFYSEDFEDSETWYEYDQRGNLIRKIIYLYMKYGYKNETPDIDVYEYEYDHNCTLRKEILYSCY